MLQQSLFNIGSYRHTTRRGSIIRIEALYIADLGQVHFVV